ncbi:hypothetical protein KIW84_071017 [Lathyrus oleraceus]|uniref:Uncharacterized protein n=1 Tax=Pisum sativum TaxID=3888 RepID=A0A9D4ZUC0_PEA|nr:hypothetical protein KIW84_071017 [Pisum sativum]
MIQRRYDALLFLFLIYGALLIARDDRIQVLIRSDHTAKWKQLLEEDMTCIINNGNVYDNDFQWKVCNDMKKFVFLSGTTVKPIELGNIHPKKFFFKEFSEILKGDRVVHEINNYQSKSGGRKIVVSLRLRDFGYKVEIYVRDGDAKYGFVFWDSDCVNIIGKTVEEMRKSMLEDGEDGPMVYPDELDSLLNKKMTFRVKNAKVVSSEENVDLSACSMSACGENELDFNGDVTPIKVNSSISKDDDLDYDIVGATQYSRTKPPKKVKIEPNS